jgi:hypothetical protein
MAKNLYENRLFYFSSFWPKKRKMFIKIGEKRDFFIFFLRKSETDFPGAPVSQNSELTERKKT